jgi:ribosomal protein S18 acetylase RimI-like enzyme
MTNASDKPPATDAPRGRAQIDRVRAATLRDLDRVTAMWTAITHHHERLDPVFAMRRDVDGALRDLLQNLHQDPDASILVYDDDGDLLGMCIVRIDHSPPIMEETRRAEITDLGVRDEARRRGVGGVLVDAALEWIRLAGVARVEVQVARGNREGQAFWRARNFGDLMDVLHLRL